MMVHQKPFGLDFFPAFFFVLVVLLFLIPGILGLINHDDYDVIVVPVVFPGVFILLIWLELKIVDSRMKKAVERYENETKEK